MPSAPPMTIPTVRVVSSACLIGALLASGQTLAGQSKPSSPQGTATQKPPVPVQGGQGGQGGQTTERPTPPKGEPGARAHRTLHPDASTASCRGRSWWAIRRPACAGLATRSVSISSGGSRRTRKPPPGWSPATAASRPQADRTTSASWRRRPPVGAAGAVAAASAAAPAARSGTTRIPACSPVQDGDIVLIDTVAQTRRALTRTTASEERTRAGPRTRNARHVHAREQPLPAVAHRQG